MTYFSNFIPPHPYHYLTHHSPHRNPTSPLNTMDHPSSSHSETRIFFDQFIRDWSLPSSLCYSQLNCSSIENLNEMASIAYQVLAIPTMNNLVCVSLGCKFNRISFPSQNLNGLIDDRCSNNCGSSNQQSV
jgi:hypothetical protein